MNRTHSDFSPAAQHALAALAGFEPSWTLSGRAALWWLPGVPRPIAQLDLVWHGAESLASLPREIVRTLTEAGLDSATLHSDWRQTWLGARQGESACLLRLVAEPTPPLERPWRARLVGVDVMVEALREVLAAALCSLYEKPDLQNLEDIGLLLRSGVPLEPGLEDAGSRNPDLSLQDLALRLARFAVEDPDRPDAGLRRLRRVQERLVFEILRRSVPDSRAS